MATVSIRVTPRAKFDSVCAGACAGDFIVRTTAVADKGRANAAVVKLLAAHFGIAKSRIRLIRGETSRDKVFELIMEN